MASPGSEQSSENRFCDRCGAQLPPDSTFCPKCGTPVSRPVQQGPQDWREQRREWRAQRRAERYGRRDPAIGGLVLATILIVAGLGIFFPQLPWQAFWGSLLILVGVWIAYFSLTRSRREAGRKPPGP